MDPNQYSHIEDFVRGMRELGQKLKKSEPDFIIAPMVGAIPFIDVLCIVDDGFENDKISYMPASNKIKNVKAVIRDWTKNFLEENYNSGELIKIAGLDEVITGNSLVRSYKQINAAIQDQANKEMYKVIFNAKANDQEIEISDKEKQKIRERFASLVEYRPFGVVDVGLRKAKGIDFNLEFQKLISQGKTDLVQVTCIPTMDRPEFFPATYRRVSDGQGKHDFYPTLEGFNVSVEYIHFLQTVAGIVGKDPEKVTFQNMSKILGSSRYLSPEFQKDY